jgi:protein-S-isoprenylcysteine O-methyltransferase Ste14
VAPATALIRTTAHVCAVTWRTPTAASVGATPERAKLGRLAGIRTAIVLIVILLLRAKLFGRQSITDNRWLQAVGLALFLCGLAIAVCARLYLGSNWGMPMSEKVDAELVTSGPYKRVRHPIYSGIVLAMVGTAVAVAWFWLIVAVLFGAYFVYSAFTEEKYMTSVLPDAYPDYKRSTKMLIPFVF